MTLFTTTLRRGLSAAALTTTALLAACSGAPSNDDLAQGINDWIGQTPTCWTVANGSNVSFPLHANLPANQISAPAQPILDGLMRGGYITLGRPASTGFAPANALDIALTDKGDDARVWNPDRGFCVGTPAVDEVKHASDPATSPRKLIHVTYTWRLANVPSWADPTLFAAVPGMAQPLTAEATMHKVDGRWEVESISAVASASSAAFPASSPVSASSTPASGAMPSSATPPSTPSTP